MTLPLAPSLDERLNPYPFYARMRRGRAVAFDEREGIWAVYCYQEVRQVLTDTRTFSSDLRQVIRPRLALRHQKPSLISSDGARHRQFRDPLSRFFTPSAVARLEGLIENHVEHLLDRVGAMGQMDVIADLAGPLPLAVITELMGVPAEDQERFMGWWNCWLAWRNGRSPFRRDTPRKRPGLWIEELDDYLRKLAACRRSEPRDDLVSVVVNLEVEGERLREEELLELFALLLIAGHVTTTHLIGNAVWCLLEHPQALQQLREEPARIPLALEEVLRYTSPVQAASRVPVRDVELGGQLVRAGEEVLAYIGSANRDEDHFAGAERFDISRSPNPHIAFGLGNHYCFGGPLARLQARVALAALLRRMHGLERVEEEPLEPNRNPFLLGTIRLVVLFDPEESGKRPE